MRKKEGGSKQSVTCLRLDANENAACC